LKVFHGPRPETARPFADLSGREILTVAPLVLLMFLLGLMPQLAMQFANPVARQLGLWIATP
jgi:NADH-quinone oxidoreductase subunit M